MSPLLLGGWMGVYIAGSSEVCGFPLLFFRASCCGDVRSCCSTTISVSSPRSLDWKKNTFAYNSLYN